MPSFLGTMRGVQEGASERLTRQPSAWDSISPQLQEDVLVASGKERNAALNALYIVQLDHQVLIV